MPRIIVTSNPTVLSADPSVWLDEEVHSVHLSTDHAATQFVERCAAEDHEAGSRGLPEDRARPAPSPLRPADSHGQLAERPIR